MQRYYVTDEQLTSIADAIRAKTGDSSQIEFPSGFVNGIDGILGIDDLEIKTVNASFKLPSAQTRSAGSSFALTLRASIPSDIALTEILKMGMISSTFTDDSVLYSNIGGDHSPTVTDKDITVGVIVTNKGNSEIVIPKDTVVSTTLSYYAYPST